MLRYFGNTETESHLHSARTWFSGPSRFLGITLGIIATGMTVSSCGSRGALEAPEPATSDQSDNSRKNIKKEVGQPKGKNDRQMSKSGRYFFLDNLIR